jgi:hypothetical protein
VGDKHDRTGDGLQVASEVWRVGGRSAQQVGRSHHGEAPVLQALDDAGPGRSVGPVAVHEHDRRPRAPVSPRLGPRGPASAEREERHEGENKRDQGSGPTRRFLSEHRSPFRSRCREQRRAEGVVSNPPTRQRARQSLGPAAYSGRRDWPGDAGVRRRRQRLVTVLSQLLDELRPDEAAPADDNDLHLARFVCALTSRSEGAADAALRIGQHATRVASHAWGRGVGLPLGRWRPTPP